MFETQFILETCTIPCAVFVSACAARDATPLKLSSAVSTTREKRRPQRGGKFWCVHIMSVEIVYVVVNQQHKFCVPNPYGGRDGPHVGLDFCFRTGIVQNYVQQYVGASRCREKNEKTERVMFSYSWYIVHIYRDISLRRWFRER